MKFHEAVEEALKMPIKEIDDVFITRNSGVKSFYFCSPPDGALEIAIDGGEGAVLSLDEILADDWKVVKEKD